MRGKLLKLFSIVAAIAMLAGAFAACATASPMAAPATQAPASAAPAATQAPAATAAPTTESLTKDFITLQVLYPGDESKRMADFLQNEFAAKLKAELNTAVEVSWSPWDQYWGKKDMMIAAGEEIDWFWDGSPNLSKVLASKSAQPIDDLLAKYGQDILKAIPATNFDACKVGGKIMAIPSQNAPTSEKFKSVIVRQDIMKEVGVTDIKSIADLENFGTLALAKHPEMKFDACIPTRHLARELFPGNITFDASDFIIVDEDTKKAQITYLSDGFKNVCEKAKEWAAKGWLPEEVTIKPSEDVNREKSGNYLIANGAISRPLEDIADLRKNVPTAELEEFLLSPDKPKYKTYSSTEIICIGATAKYPERAMMMLDWMLKSKENYLFCIYGVEGKDYTIENNTIKLINQDSLWYEWMFRNINYMMFPDNVTPEFINSFTNWDKDAKLSCHYGFVFDETPVKDEVANCTQIVNDKFNGMATGMVDYDQNFAAAKDALLAAGAQKILDEYQKQLDAFIAGH